MIPDRDSIKAEFLGLLDDPNGATFTDSIFQIAFSSAFDALFQGMLNHQVPRIKLIAQYTLPPMTTSFAPADASLSNFGDIDELEERLSGSTEKYRHVEEVDKLWQRNPGDRLCEFVWRVDSFFFIGATTPRDLRITFESSGVAPTDVNTAVGIDGCQSFLANFAVGKAGRRKGYDEIAADCMEFAVGPRYSQGQIGGELWRLISAKVREMQHVQIAQRRYSADRGCGIRRRVPYIAAQSPTGGATAPAQFTTADGTITGTRDGVNATFFLAYPVATAYVYRNGVRMTNGTDVIFGANQIIFQAGQIPLSDDIITAEGWL